MEFAKNYHYCSDQYIHSIHDQVRSCLRTVVKNNFYLVGLRDPYGKLIHNV